MSIKKRALIINCYQNDYFLSSLYEMENLLTTLDIEPALVCYFECKEISRATFITSGAVEICIAKMFNHDIDLIVFNNDLSPLQIRNLSKAFNKEIFDRSMIIIKIFEYRAKTKEAKLQVEIASLKYNAARLVQKDFNYDQITSGKGKNKGLGEKLINLRKQEIKDSIARKEKELHQIQLNRHLNRVKRKNNLPLVTIVGYTNAGKSTLLNQLIKITDNKRKDLILEENRLFATLDTTTRLIKTNQCIPFLITDTVGFIANLPTHLIKSFRSTFEEIVESDLIVEVVDISSEYSEAEIEITEKIIRELSSAKIIRLYNKIDELSSNYPMVSEDELLVSLKDENYIDDVLRLIDKNLSQFYLEVSLFIPYDQLDVFYEIKENHCVIDYVELENGIKGNFKIFKNQFKKYQKFLKMLDKVQ